MRKTFSNGRRWQLNTVQEAAAAVSRIDRRCLYKVLHGKFPSFDELSRARQRELADTITSALAWAISAIESEQNALRVADTRKNLIALKEAMENVCTARTGLDIVASSKLHTAVALGIVHNDGYHPERGVRYWSDFDRGMQDALKWRSTYLI